MSDEHHKHAAQCVFERIHDECLKGTGGRFTYKGYYWSFERCQQGSSTWTCLWVKKTRVASAGC